MNYNNILFLDIETVAQHEHYSQLSDAWRDLWDHKAKSLIRNPEVETAETIYDKAGIYAEFGKVICISVGCIQGEAEDRKLVLTSYAGHDEKTLLLQFAEMMKKWSGSADKLLCAHNGKEFDFPYLCRRMIINSVEIPEALKIAGRKPWEVRHLDTLEMWKFGDYKNYISLKLLAQCFGIPSPKDDIDGSQVYGVYYKEKNLDRIVTYCQKDVTTLAQVLLRYHCQPLIKKENISVKFKTPVALKGEWAQDHASLF
jgi:3'-5' exonuclease